MDVWSSWMDMSLSFKLHAKDQACIICILLCLPVHIPDKPLHASCARCQQPWTMPETLPPWLRLIGLSGHLSPRQPICHLAGNMGLTSWELSLSYSSPRKLELASWEPKAVCNREKSQKMMGSGVVMTVHVLASFMKGQKPWANRGTLQGRKRDALRDRRAVSYRHHEPRTTFQFSWGPALSYPRIRMGYLYSFHKPPFSWASLNETLFSHSGNYRTRYRPLPLQSTSGLSQQQLVYI